LAKILELRVGNDSYPFNKGALMKLSEQQQRKIMKDNPAQGFDICSKCDNVQLYGTMKDINQNDFDLICDDCLKEKND
jgi:hypothetical protein